MLSASFWCVHYYMNTKAVFRTRWAWWAGYSCQASMQIQNNSLPCYGLSLNLQSYCSFCSWGVCIINSWSLPLCTSPVCCGVFVAVGSLPCTAFFYAHQLNSSTDDIHFCKFTTIGGCRSESSVYISMHFFILFVLCCTKQ